MKQFFILNFCIAFSFSLFCADKPGELKKKQYIYLINPVSIPAQENTPIASDDLIFLTIDPYIIFTYLQSQKCSIQSYHNINYYKIPSSAIKGYDWSEYRESKQLTPSQQAYFSFETNINIAKRDLFEPFPKVLITEKTLTLKGHFLMNWQTGKKVKTVSL